MKWKKTEEKENDGVFLIPPPFHDLVHWMCQGFHKSHLGVLKWYDFLRPQIPLIYNKDLKSVCFFFFFKVPSVIDQFAFSWH